MSTKSFAVLAFAAAFSALPAAAATYGELSGNGGNGGMGQPYASGAYAPAPVVCPPYCNGQPISNGGPEGIYPDQTNNAPTPWDIPAPMMAPRLYMPLSGRSDLPHNQLQLWSFSQYNSTTDPFNPWGLSTPYMFMPWSTPLSGWTNAQTWNWWRERSGALPRNW